MTLVSMHDDPTSFDEFPDAFVGWLRQQRKRDDPVGDIARDHLADEQQRRCEVSADDLASQARDNYSAWRAFECALREWQTHRVLFS